jgi:ankyrin repeat protein
MKDGADVNLKDRVDMAPIHYASEGGHIECLQELIKCGADVNLKNRWDKAAIHYSTEGGRTEALRELINVNLKDGWGKAPLHYASAGGHTEALQELIKGGADVNLKDRVDKCPIHYASQGGHTAVLRKLIKSGADVNPKDVDDKAPIHYASEGGHTEVLRKLIKSGADVNLKDVDDKAPIHYASEGGHAGAVWELIKGGADVNLKDGWGKAPIHYASEGGHAGALQELIKCGADVDSQDKHGQGPIFEAVNGGHVNIIVVLIQNLVNINATDLKGQTPIQCGLLSDKPGSSEAILELTNQGAVIVPENQSNVEDTVLQTLYLRDRNLYIEVIKRMIIQDKLCATDRKALSLEVPEAVSNLEVLQVLCDFQHCLYISDEFGRTVLHNIVSLGHHEAIKTLLSHGVHITGTDSLGQTLLHCAIPIGNEGTVHNLLNAGCDLKARDKFDRTVLHLAAFYGHCKLIELFISKGLDPDATDTDGRNSLHFAVMNRQDEAVRVLVQKGANSEVIDKSRMTLLHSSEKNSLTSRRLHGYTDRLPVLKFSDEEFSPSITNAPNLAVINRIPGIGSVQSIKDFSMEDFLKKIEKKIEDILNQALQDFKLTLSLIGCGSCFEGSKIVMPGEVDFIMKMDMLDGAHLPIADGEGYLSMCGNVGLHGSYSVWLWYKLLTWWSKCQLDEMSDKEFQMPFPPLRHPEHTTCVNWVWLFTDDLFHMMPVSIDLVVALYDDKNGLYIVPKVPAESYLMKRFRTEDKSFGRMSYPPQEVKHLSSLPPEDKDVYVTAKCLRLPEICGFKIQDDKNNIRIVSEYATSYRLKTVFLHLSEMFKDSKLSHGRKVLLVFEWLESCLERETLPIFFNTSYNVLAGSRLSTTESLKVVRAMTKFVRKLYERDYESVLAQDEEEVKQVHHMIPSCLPDTGEMKAGVVEAMGSRDSRLADGLIPSVTEEKKEEEGVVEAMGVHTFIPSDIKEKEVVQTMGQTYKLYYDEEKGIYAFIPSDMKEREVVQTMGQTYKLDYDEERGAYAFMPADIKDGREEAVSVPHRRKRRTSEEEDETVSVPAKKKRRTSL